MHLNIFEKSQMPFSNLEAPLQALTFADMSEEELIEIEVLESIQGQEVNTALIAAIMRHNGFSEIHDAYQAAN